MPREFSRTQRVGDQMQRELARLLQMEMKDPRVRMVTVNGVEVSKDLGYADVYITLMSIEELTEQSPEVKEVLRVLKNASGFLRSELGRSIKLRVTPSLRFHYDTSVGRGRHLSSLIDTARRQDEALAKGRDEGE